MPLVSVNPNEFLIVGQNGKVVNRGSGINAFLWPGTPYVLIPSTKQEARFEMTQETKDGIPLRFKGIVIYRIVDPVKVSISFNFNDGQGFSQINSMIGNICLGELRALVSGMTMTECIEQRKTVLTTTIDRALRAVVNGETEQNNWGVDLELVQVAQVFIVDSVLRQQLEAEVRNEIQAKSQQSEIQTKQFIELTNLAAQQKIIEQKMEIEKETIRRNEEFQLAQIISERKIREQRQLTQKEEVRLQEELEKANLDVVRRQRVRNQEAEKERILLDSEKMKFEQAAVKEKVETETPVKLLEVQSLNEVYARELEMRRLEFQVHELQTNRNLLLEKARHDMRRELLPVEQVPEIAESLSGLFHRANLSIIGGDNQVLNSILPLIQTLATMIKVGMPQQGDMGAGEPSERKRTE